MITLAATVLWLSPAKPAHAEPDTTRPTIVSGPTLNSPASGDTYREGETITISFTFSEPVSVSGNPHSRIRVGEKGKRARYASSNDDGDTLVFRYKVKSGDSDSDGIRMRKNSLKLGKNGSIEDASGNAAKLKHAGLSDQSGHKVNGSADEPESSPQPTATTTPAQIETAQPATQSQQQQQDPEWSRCSWLRNTTSATDGAPMWLDTTTVNIHGLHYVDDTDKNRRYVYRLSPTWDPTRLVLSFSFDISSIPDTLEVNETDMKPRDAAALVVKYFWDYNSDLDSWRGAHGSERRQNLVTMFNDVNPDPYPGGVRLRKYICDPFYLVYGYGIYRLRPVADSLLGDGTKKAGRDWKRGENRDDYFKPRN